ncbi:hypothetical protein [Streptomyces sp. NPDC047315]|uniref:hypothetical protein n=1 Tax=Streptomyces sp. NPDC047315 TaxID=3155142 RepID=UPI0033C07DBB
MPVHASETLRDALDIAARARVTSARWARVRAVVVRSAHAMVRTSPPATRARRSRQPISFAVEQGPVVLFGGELPHGVR